MDIENVSSEKIFKFEISETNRTLMYSDDSGKYMENCLRKIEHTAASTGKIQVTIEQFTDFFQKK